MFLLLRICLKPEARFLPQRDLGRGFSGRFWQGVFHLQFTRILRLEPLLCLAGSFVTKLIPAIGVWKQCWREPPTPKLLNFETMRLHQYRFRCFAGRLHVLFGETLQVLKDLKRFRSRALNHGGPTRPQWGPASLPWSVAKRVEISGKVHRFRVCFRCGLFDTLENRVVTSGDFCSFICGSSEEIRGVFQNRAL